VIKRREDRLDTRIQCQTNNLANHARMFVPAVEL
jgi:hypothetical protein